MTPTTPSDGLAVHAEGLGKRFGDRCVLRDVDLAVPAGTVLGVLGPNGAGKTTAVRILTTLLRPDAGRAHVAGIDVVADPTGVRPHIGLAGQQATVDELLTGRANLELIAGLYHLPRKRRRARAAELLEQLSLTDAADRLVRTYSGGMRRRLDLAASLVADPAVLFMDEPTTGLDPHSRNELWAVLRERVAAGTTILLTTQYLEEADQLADRIAVIDHGRVIAEGRPDELKRRVGGERLVATMHAAHELDDAARALGVLTGGPAQIDAAARQVSVALPAGGTMVAALRALDAAGTEPLELAVRTPTLDDVFLTLTGHAPADIPTPEVLAA